MRVPGIVALLFGLGSFAAEKPLIVYKAPSGDEDERPVIVSIGYSPRGSDFSLRLQFDKAPWGDACRSRCANATVFLDTDNNRSTGLKLDDPKAAETGADLAITVQGMREVSQGAMRPSLRVKVTQYAESATSPEQGTTLAELSPSDGERVLSDGKSLYLLVDASIGDIPQGSKVRVVYHPPGAKPLAAVGKGLLVPGAGRVEIYKEGRLTNPGRKKEGASDEPL